MNNAFIFETEQESAFPQGEFAYENYEGNYEGEGESLYEGEGEGLYEGEGEGLYEGEGEGYYEAEGEGDYEADFEGDYEGDFEAAQYEDMEGEVIRDHRRGGGVARPMGFRGLARPGIARAFGRPLAYRFRPGAYRYRPGAWGYRRGPWGYGRRPWGYRYRPYGWRRGGPYYGGQPQGVGVGFGLPGAPGGPGAPGAPGVPGGGGSFPAEGIGSPSESSSIVMLLQRLLNRVMNTNLPVDGMMNVETRSAIRSFQSQPADATPPAPPAPGPPTPSTPDAGTPTPPQGEFDEMSYFENEYGEFGY